MCKDANRIYGDVATKVSRLWLTAVCVVYFSMTPSSWAQQALPRIVWRRALHLLVDIW